MSRFSLLQPLDEPPSPQSSESSDNPEGLGNPNNPQQPFDGISLATGLDYLRQAQQLANQLNLPGLLDRRSLLERCYRIFGFHYESHCMAAAQSGVPFLPSRWPYFRPYLEVQVSLSENLLFLARLHIANKRYEDIIADNLFVKGAEHLKRALYMNDEAIAAEQQVIELSLRAQPNEALEFSQWINKFWADLEDSEDKVERRLADLEEELSSSRLQRDDVKQRLGEDRWRRGPSKIADASPFARHRDDLMKQIALIKSLQEEQFIPARQNLPPRR